MPSTLTFDHLLQALDATRPGMVTVIAASPGAGKSTAMYHAVAHRMAERHLTFHPTPFRVLWATHGTKGDTSLGQEARRELIRSLIALGCPDRVGMLRSQDSFPARSPAYLKQFDWSEDPDATLRIISHAHLPVLLNPDAPTHVQDFLRQVDLIVVDEDPLFSLVFSLDETGRPFSPARLEERKASGTAGPVELAVLQVMQDALGGDGYLLKPLEVRHPITDQTFFSVTGQGFWESMQANLSAPPDWAGFVEALSEVAFTERLPARLKEELAVALADDWRQATAHGIWSQRFGITWQNDDPSTMRFRADILRTLRPDTPPIIVLDAYADETNGQYQRMFKDHAVGVRRLTPIVPLDVEVNTDWYIDRTNLTSSRQQPRRDHLMDEVGRLTQGHPKGTLVLSYRRVTKYLGRPSWATHWQRHAPELNQSAKPGERPIEFSYWFAGRGVNAYAGRHVVALHAPERPSLFQQHHLAALAPYDAQQRAELAGHLRDTELLQMLHRGRQGKFRLDDPQRPRIILAFEPEGDLTGWVQRIQHPVERPIRPDTTNIHHQHALGTLAVELHTLLGAVPHVCLSVLGLYTPSVTEAQQLETVRAGMVRVTRHTKRRAPNLDGWAGDNQKLRPRLSPYTALKGDKPKRILAAMAENPELNGLKCVKVPTRWPGGRTRVYANDEASAIEAVRRLGG